MSHVPGKTAVFGRRQGLRPYIVLQMGVLVILYFGPGRLWARETTAAGDVQIGSKWDRTLPAMELQNVHIDAGGITKAWQVIVKDFGIRTVLYVEWKSPLEKASFTFDKVRCTADELLSAFTAGYGYTRTPDSKTGIIWLHPASVAYRSILPAKVKVDRDLCQVPFATKCFYPLCRIKGLGMVNGGMGGMENTLDSPVNLSSGVYSTRDLLNLLCFESPNQTFVTTAVHNGLMVTAVPVMSFRPEGAQVVPTPGALLYWRTEVNPASKEGPTDSEFVDALANPKADIRSGARTYFDMTLPLARFEKVLSQPAPAAKAVWVSVGVLSVMTRGDVPAWPSAAARLRTTLTDSDALSGKPALYALAATELARVEKDASYLEQAAKRPLSASELADVRPDLIRNLCYSSFVRDKFLELEPKWAGFSKPQVETVGQTNSFSLP